MGLTPRGYLESVVRPATEFQHARLLVEREKFHVDLARRFEYGRRFPFYQPYVVYGRLGRQRHVEIAVGAADHIQTHKLQQKRRRWHNNNAHMYTVHYMRTTWYTGK